MAETPLDDGTGSSEMIISTCTFATPSVCLLSTKQDLPPARAGDAAAAHSDCGQLWLLKVDSASSRAGSLHFHPRGRGSSFANETCTVMKCSHEPSPHRARMTGGRGLSAFASESQILAGSRFTLCVPACLHFRITGAAARKLQMHVMEVSARLQSNTQEPAACGARTWTPSAGQTASRWTMWRRRIPQRVRPRGSGGGPMQHRLNKNAQRGRRNLCICLQHGQLITVKYATRVK